MARIGPIDESKLTDEQRLVFDAVKAGPRGRVSPPFQALLPSPKLADRTQQLGAFLRYGTSLPRRVSELGILVTARHWDCAFQWASHSRDALAAGLPQSVIDSLARGEVPSFAAADEKAAYEYSVMMHRDHRVDNATYKAALDAFGLVGVVELNGLLGYYCMMAMTLKSFEILPAAS